ncbi:hypothetical protein, partial [Leptolyngbya sp. FACHB-36]|uniref:hypothetical protein n=1 Tax=Leptolyngbya sp. FACHB-36 TaxID=2692808 RepID=UPI001A7E949D
AFPTPEFTALNLTIGYILLTPFFRDRHSQFERCLTDDETNPPESRQASVQSGSIHPSVELRGLLRLAAALHRLHGGESGLTAAKLTGFLG